MHEHNNNNIMHCMHASMRYMHPSMKSAKQSSHITFFILR